MKKKLILLAGLIVLLIINFIAFTLNAKMDGKRMFGINESKYEVVKKDCTMSRIKEGGKIDIYLKVSEEQIDEFIDEIESFGAESEEIEPVWYNFIKKNMQMDPAQVERFYRGFSIRRRTFISYLLTPSERYTWITISACKDGYYDVRLWGWEIPSDPTNPRDWCFG